MPEVSISRSGPSSNVHGTSRSIWCHARSCCAALLVLIVVGSHTHATSVVPFFFERTIYLEGLLSPLAWWANPASVVECESPTLFTANASPIGRYFTVSSVRFFLPIRDRVTLGFGVMGAGPDQTGSLNATGDGVSYCSNFIFSRPSFQVGTALKLPLQSSVGGLFSIGMEQASVGLEQFENFALLGLGLGWLSPAIVHMVQFSLSAFWAGHFHHETYWDGDFKLGVRVRIPDDLVSFKLEYSHPMPEALQYHDLLPSIPIPYAALNVLVAVRTGALWSVLLGYSSDFGEADTDNGNALHAGIDLRQSEQLPFFGGYEVAISMDRRWNVIHRFWLGYNMQRPDVGAIEQQETTPR